MTQRTTKRTGGTTARRQSTSEDPAVNMGDLRHRTLMRSTADQIPAHLMMTKTVSIIDHHGRTKGSPVMARVLPHHPTMGMVLRRQTISITNTALPHHYHLAISTNPTLLHLIGDVHTKGPGDLRNLIGTVHRETTTITKVLPHQGPTIIAKTCPNTTGHNLNTMITLDPSNCVQQAHAPPRNIKSSNPSLLLRLQTTKQSATYTPTGPYTISTYSTSTVSPPEKHPTARSIRKISCC